MVGRYERECKKTDNACASAMHTFNRHNNPNAVRMGNSIPKQPTAYLRRKVYMSGGRNMNLTGRPPQLVYV